jgi:hypothetical protein
VAFTKSVWRGEAVGGWIAAEVQLPTLFRHFHQANYAITRRQPLSTALVQNDCLDGPRENGRAASVVSLSVGRQITPPIGSFGTLEIFDTLLP